MGSMARASSNFSMSPENFFLMALSKDISWLCSKQSRISYSTAQDGTMFPKGGGDGHTLVLRNKMGKKMKKNLYKVTRTPRFHNTKVSLANLALQIRRVVAHCVRTSSC